MTVTNRILDIRRDVRDEVLAETVSDRCQTHRIPWDLA